MRAIHLNHGLNPKANLWQQHAQQVCDDLQIPFISFELKLNIPKSESIEATARAARYAYFAQNLKPSEILCTAHHQDDQLETVLLQLLRGAGPKGLAAMPELQHQHARPLLTISHDLILNYAQENNLSWIHDDSNENIQFDRNFLRQNIIPLLKQRFPAAASTVSRSAQHCASSQAVLEHYLNQELLNLQGDFPDTLSRQKLLNFDENTQAYLLRTWLMNKQFPMPSSVQLEQIQKLLALKNDVKAIISWQDYSVRLYRDSLFAQETKFFNLPEPEISEQAIKLIQTSLGQENIMINFYKPGHGRGLKKIFQALNIPPWQRGQMPLIYVDHKLTAIALPNQLIRIPL